MSASYDISTGGSVYDSHSSFRKRKGCIQSRPYFVVRMIPTISRLNGKCDGQGSFSPQ